MRVSVRPVYGGEARYHEPMRRYDPAADAWTLTSTSVAPAPRSSHTAVWTGAEMIVWGRDFDALAAFEATPGEEDGRLLDEAELADSLTAAGIPMAP